MSFCIYVSTIHRSQIIVMTDITSYCVKKVVAVMTVCCVLTYLTSLGEHVFFQVISKQILYSALLWCWLQIIIITNSTRYPLIEPFLMHVSFCITGQYFMQFQENFPFCLCSQSTFCYGHVCHHVTSRQIVPSVMWKGSLGVLLDTLLNRYFNNGKWNTKLCSHAFAL